MPPDWKRREVWSWMIYAFGCGGCNGYLVTSLGVWRASIINKPLNQFGKCIVYRWSPDTWYLLVLLLLQVATSVGGTPRIPVLHSYGIDDLFDAPVRMIKQYEPINNMLIFLAIWNYKRIQKVCSSMCTYVSTYLLRFFPLRSLPRYHVSSWRASSWGGGDGKIMIQHVYLCTILYNNIFIHMYVHIYIYIYIYIHIMQYTHSAIWYVSAFGVSLCL